MKECCQPMARTTVRSEEEKRELTNRINRIAGQMNGVKQMVENDRYCDDILVQLAAIEKAVRSMATLVLERHMHRCLIEEVRKGNIGVVDEVLEFFKRFG